MMRLLVSLLLPCMCVLASTAAADPWADAVVEYDAGSNPGAGFTDPTTALGIPTRVTTTSFGSGPVTPFFPVGGNDEAVSIGEGGSLTVRFDTPVKDAVGNPFGIDLLVFGNAFLFGSEFPITPTTTVTGFFDEGGVISVSEDGVAFTEVTGVSADALYPTVGFRGFDGGGLSNFLLPVDPSYDPLGDTPAEVYAAYAGSGGGAGIDIGALGFSQISFVRVTNPLGSGVTPEIDAFADVQVPEPSSLACLAIAAMTARLGRRRR
ncbi:MAG: PEP-CTERM sorting domain-containing protein [Planctomycetota bacterium]